MKSAQTNALKSHNFTSGKISLFNGVIFVLCCCVVVVVFV
jgi:hypothetical protein